MYTYKRNKRFPLKRTRYELTSLLKSKVFNIKAALYSGIVLMLVLSFIFISSAGALNNKLAYGSSGQPAEASGSEDTSVNISIPKFILSQEMPVIYGVNLEDSDSVQPIDGLKNTEIDINIATEEIKMDIIKYAQEPKEFYVGAQGPQVLIYHTHEEEAYRQIVGQEYVEAGKFYTKDEFDSVFAVGEALKAQLESKGYSVMHDGTDHMTEGLSGAYSKSLVTMEKYANQYPTIRVYIDVHRDASSNEKDFVTVNGDECAKIMFVVGPNKTPEEKPKFESNYKLALAITNEMEKIKSGFTRLIRVQNSSKHYNQQVSDMCLLVEVGHNANSLQQAINTTKYIAEAISRVIVISGP